LRKEPTGTKEWAVSNINFAKGCPHDCVYCYAKSMAIRFGRATGESWKNTEVQKTKVEAIQKKHRGQIMIPSSHDLVPEILDQAKVVIRNLLEKGNKILIVSKPHFSVIEEICAAFNNYRDQILFRFSIGSSDDSKLSKYEPGAPNFEERIKALKYAYEHFYKTSISIEPMLDLKPRLIVEKVYGYVTDSIWLGKLNNAGLILATNRASEEIKKEIVVLLKAQNKDWVFDLYETYKNDPKIRWKDSIKKIVGLDRPEQAGLDI
jgi:DNA repair photolyase